MIMTQSLPFLTLAYRRAMAPGSTLNLDGGGRVLSNGQLQLDSTGVPLGTGGNVTASVPLRGGRPGATKRRADRNADSRSRRSFCSTRATSPRP